MSKKKFTEEEIAILAANPYTYRVSPGQISFTREFKQLFWADYQKRLEPAEIFRRYGYDPAVLGRERVRSFQRSLKNESEKGLDFHEGRRPPGTRKEPTTDGPYSTVIRDMEHRLSYLEQEVDFLKKISSVRTSKK